MKFYDFFASELFKIYIYIYDYIIFLDNNMNDEVKNKIESIDNAAVENTEVENTEVENTEVENTEVENTAVDQMISDVASNPNADNNLKSEQLINNKEKSGVTICIPIENFDENMTIKDVMSANTNGQSRNISDQVAQSKKVILKLKVPNKTCTAGDIENFFRANDFRIFSPTESIFLSGAVIDMPFFDGIIIKYAKGDEYAEVHIGFDDHRQKVEKLISKIEAMPLFPDPRSPYEVLSNTNWLNQSNDGVISEGGKLEIVLKINKPDLLVYIFGNPFYPNGYFIFNEMPLKIVLKRKIDINTFSDLSKLEIQHVETTLHGNGLAPNGLIDGKLINVENGKISLYGTVSKKPTDSQNISVEKATIYNISNFSLIFNVNSSTTQMKVVIPKCLTTEEQTLSIKNNQNTMYYFTEKGFIFNSTNVSSIHVDKIIPKNLLIKMPIEFYSGVQNDPKTFEAALKNKIVNGNQCTVNFTYKDIKNESFNLPPLNIEFIFKTKNLSSLNSDQWSNEIKSLLFNQSFSRTSPIYLESVKNLNYFVKFDKDGRALYNSETNTLGLAKIIEYKNPENKLLAETNLIQPFYEYQTSPQTYNFGKKIFWYFKNCDSCIISKGDGKKVIIGLDKKSCIEIYFDDMENLSKANKMTLFHDNIRSEINLENCNVSVNLPMVAKKNTDTYFKNNRWNENDFMSFRLSSAGLRVQSFSSRKWLGEGYFGSEDSSYSMHRSWLEGTYFGVEYIDNPSIVSIEFDAIDINKNVTVTLPSYTPSNDTFTKINLNHGGFIISGFNLDKIEFDREFNSIDLENPNTRTNVVAQEDFVNEAFMTKLIDEQQKMSKSYGEEYQYVNVVYYNPNDDLDGKIRDKLFDPNSKALGLFLLIVGLVSMGITLAQKILVAAGIKISKNFKLVLDIIQMALNLTKVIGGQIDKPLTFLENGVAKFESVIKGLTSLGGSITTAISALHPAISGNVGDLIQGINQWGQSASSKPPVTITEDTMIRWRDGIKEVALAKDTSIKDDIEADADGIKKTADEKKTDIANTIVTSAYIFATCGNIGEFMKTLNITEATIISYLDNILKYGAEYIYKTAGGKISIGEAEILNFIFIKRASISYLEGFVKIYQG